MLLPLDLSPIFSGARKDDDYVTLRHVVMGGLDPVSFLNSSVSQEDMSRWGGRFDALELAEEGEEPQEPQELGGDEGDHLLMWLCKAKGAFASVEGEMTPEVLEKIRLGFRKAVACQVSSREAMQLWACLRSLESFPGARVAKSVLGVCLEFMVGSKPFLIFCDADYSLFGIWEGGSARFSRYTEGEVRELVSDVLAAGEGGLESFSLFEQVPPPPLEGEFSATVLTPSGWRSTRVGVSELDMGPLGVCYRAFSRLRVLLERESEGKDLVLASEYSFDYEDPRWVFPSLGVRAMAFCLDAFAFFSLWGVLVYALYAFSGGITPLLGGGMLVAALVLFPVFLAIFESSGTHTSFGKRFFSLYVVSVVRGTGTGFYQSLVRNYCKCYLSWSFGWIWGMFHPYRRMYHDVMVDTVVIFDDKESELLESLKEELRPDF